MEKSYPDFSTALTALGNPATDAGFPHSHSHDDDGLPRTGPNINTRTNTNTKINTNTNNKTKVVYTDNLTHPFSRKSTHSLQPRKSRS